MDKQTLANELLEVSKFHDWEYEYSDDYSVYAAGRKQLNLMWGVYDKLRSLDPELANVTWNSIAPNRWKRKS